MEIYELLDRFELLYPSVPELADLRRAYIDQDLRSIFKLVNFEDLAGLILDDNKWKLAPLLNRYVDTEFANAFKVLHANEIPYDSDCFSRGQLRSKMWLVDELIKTNKNLGTVFLCAGWYATLAVMIFESGIKVDKIRSFDIDPTTVNIAEIFNKNWVKDGWKFKSSIGDILDINYKEHSYLVKRSDNSLCELTDNPDTIINTSCEHIKNFNEWYDKIPTEKLVVLQSNDYFEIAEHVNCSTDLLDFSKKSPMKTVLFEGELELPKYKRFMKIGIK